MINSNNLFLDFFIDAQTPNATELGMQGVNHQSPYFNTFNIEHNTTNFNVPQTEQNSYSTSNDLCIEIE